MKCSYLGMWACLLLGSHMGTSEQIQSFFPPEKLNLLSQSQREKVQLQLREFDFKGLIKQRQSLFLKEEPLTNLSSFKDFENSSSIDSTEAGENLLAQGAVGCLIIAGGQGSRLGFEKPKGLYPITLFQKKSLFQLFSERILAAGKKAGRPLWVAIMTSAGNDEETKAFFRENAFFGLSETQIFFFSQKELPLLDKNGNLFLETKEKIATGPDGNASSLKHFVSSGIWEKWKEAGITYVNYLHVDNALADPFDVKLTDFHSRVDSDLIIKSVFRENPLEKIGVLFEVDGKTTVVEYSEISPEERDAKDREGVLKNRCANIGLYSLKIDFIYDVATKYYDLLPFHKAFKSATLLKEDGTSALSSQPIAWKFEKFIFDIFPFAKNIKALLYPRELCFAPLKNKEGEDSKESVQKALLNYDRLIFEEVTGQHIDPGSVFELDPAFYYPTESLAQKWHGKKVPDSSYITR